MFMFLFIYVIVHVCDLFEWTEFEQSFFPLFGNVGIAVGDPNIKMGGGGFPTLTGLILPNLCACLPGHEFAMPYVMVFFVFNHLR